MDGEELRIFRSIFYKDVKVERVKKGDHKFTPLSYDRPFFFLGVCLFIYSRLSAWDILEFATCSDDSFFG